MYYKTIKVSNSLSSRLWRERKTVKLALNDSSRLMSAFNWSDTGLDPYKWAGAYNSGKLDKDLTIHLVCYSFLAGVSNKGMVLQLSESAQNLISS